MSDEISELVERDFARAMPRKQRERILRGQPIGGEDIVAIRRFVGLTQQQFADALEISVHTLRNWEQARRTPEGSALALLRVAVRHPRVLRERHLASVAARYGPTADHRKNWRVSSRPVSVGVAGVKLFDEDLNRTDEGPATYVEPPFQYLNRSARPEVGRIRELLEDWFGPYPTYQKEEFRARFRSDEHHRSAFFELFLHQLFVKLGCVVTVHPVMPEPIKSRPDFLVQAPDGRRFIVEAVLAEDESRKDAARRARMNVVYDALQRLDSPNFFIGLEMMGAPESPPSARKMKAFLAPRLAQLDPDAVARQTEERGWRSVPRWRYEEAGWRIDFFPIPKTPAARGKPGIRPIGVVSHGVRQLKTWEAIRDAVVSKGGEYGDPGLPYLIAVNVLADHVDRITVMEGLFGQEQIAVRWSGGGPGKPESGRAPNGAWTSQGGPRYTRVSGVLVAIQLSSWNVRTGEICVYHNPWATRPYESVLNRLPRAQPKGNRMIWHEGQQLNNILELPQGWPAA